jgi:hypothetical protein
MTKQQIKVERGATLDVRFFGTIEEARRFIRKRGE